MLDETTCPVCGKYLGPPHEVGHTASHEFSARAARWAVAHYLAHLAQQNQPQAPVQMWPTHLAGAPPDELVAVED